jgi:hypothetical protein
MIEILDGLGKDDRVKAGVQEAEQIAR